MGTGQSCTDTQKRVSKKPPRCSICRHEYTPTCDFMQGRCPHHPAMISTKVVKTRIQNLINFFKGNKR
jgi:hypothetical protein